MLFALDVSIRPGLLLRRQLRELASRCCPGELAAGVLATIFAVAYTNLGLCVLFARDHRLAIFHD